MDGQDSGMGYWLCLEVSAHADHHWWGLRFPATGGAVLAHSWTGGPLLWIAISDLMHVLSAVDNLYYFQVASIDAERSIPDDPVYHIPGKAASSTCAMALPAAAMSTTLRLTILHQACLECGSSLRKEQDIQARLYHLEGVRPIYHTTKKCANGNCAAMHHYNYRWVDGKRMNTASIYILDYIFVNPKVAFARSFLDYHGALQFRGCLSIHAIAFAQKNVL